MGLALFFIVGAVTLFGAIGVVTTRNVVYAALFLLVSLGGWLAPSCCCTRNSWRSSRC